jgi:lipid A ethanolaminephosphotransferase
MRQVGKSWRPEYIILAVSVAMVVFYNAALWKHFVVAVHPEGWEGRFLLLTTFFLLTAFFSLVQALLPFRWITRPLLTILLPLSALSAYFMSQYGTAIDDKMVQNVFETDVREADALLTWLLLLYFIVLGVVPVVAIWRLKLRPFVLVDAVKARALLILACLLVVILAAAFFYETFASTVRANRDLRFYITPNSFIKGGMDLFLDEESTSVTLKEVGTDARKGPSWTPRKNKALVVLVIGETARSANFSLNGYSRDTNPELEKQSDIVSFRNAYSCGTDTAVSLPCMLSGLGRENYKLARARSQENLLDVIQHAGIPVLWVENQSGCKRTCDRVSVRINTTDMTLPEFCQGGECHDAIMAAELNKYVKTLKQDTLVVMHMMGSHGPAYYRRYPTDAEHFKPVCRTSLLGKCSDEAIVNAYDNTIRYTDHALASVLDVLRKFQGERDTAMIYMSDHGESLGEYGLYLHGAPYMLAPDFQKHIPAVIWLSPDMENARGVKAACLSQQKDAAISHDNLYHSLLGLLDIQTAVYQPDLDIFRPCYTGVGK